MPPLRRHQLAYPTPAGWRAVLGQAWDDEARACLRHWAAHGLPLVITRQPVPDEGVCVDGASIEAPDPMLALGLCAPLAWGRRHITLQVPLADIGWFSEFPLLERVLPELPRAAKPSLQALCLVLATRGMRARVYGSVGWQRLSGLRCRHAASDLDLWIGVEGAAVADEVAAALQQHAPPGLRLDGELVFADGGAVAWREWAAWRAARSRALLVKRLHGVSIEHAPFVELSLSPSRITWPCAA